MNDEFEKRRSRLLKSDPWNGFRGIHHGTRFHTKAGVSSHYSEVYFSTEVDENDLGEIPDYTEANIGKRLLHKRFL